METKYLILEIHEITDEEKRRTIVSQKLSDLINRNFMCSQQPKNENNDVNQDTFWDYNRN